MFVNLMHMREAVSIGKYGNHHTGLSDENLRKLQHANFLFHASLNGGVPSVRTLMCGVVCHHVYS